MSCELVDGLCSQENINSDLGRLGSADRKIDHSGVSSSRARGMDDGKERMIQ